MLGRIAAFFYGVVCYLTFLGTFLYAVGFLGNYAVPKSIDSGPQLPLGHALAINFTLLGLFALQHSVMARPWFKRAWTRMIPTPIERSTYVLFSSLALLLLFWKWQSMGGVIWNVESAYGRLVLKGLYVFGWLTVRDNDVSHQPFRSLRIAPGMAALAWRRIHPYEGRFRCIVGWSRFLPAPCAPQKWRDQGCSPRLRSPAKLCSLGLS